MCACVCVVTCVYVIIIRYMHQYGNEPLIIIDAPSPLKKGLHNIAEILELVNICQPTNPSQSGLLHPGTGESKASAASTSSSSISILLTTEDHFTRPRFYR